MKTINYIKVKEKHDGEVTTDLQTDIKLWSYHEILKTPELKITITA